MPNGTQLVASPKEILLLAKGLVQDIQRVEALNNALRHDLDAISKSWLDDGFVEVNEYLTRIHKAMEERKDNVGLVARELVCYADKLRGTK